MQLTLVKTIFRKELRDVLRDRRTLFMMLVLPVILYPVLFIGFAQIASMQAAKIAAKQTRVAILGREHSHELAVMLDTLSGVTVADTSGWRERITASELEAALVIPDNFADSMANRQRPSVVIYYNSSKEISQKARGQFRNILQLFRDRVVEERLIGLSADTSVLHPFDMKIENLATEQQQQGDLLGRILGYLLIMMAVSGAFYPALDLTAGEKERGTMETLLVSPAGRDDIVYGKFLAVITISLISIILNVLSLGLTMVYLVSLVGAAVEMPAIAISPVSLLFTLLLLIPLTVIFSAVCMAVAVCARNYKEGQNLLTPVYFIAFMPAMIAAIPGIEITPVSAMIPIVNVTLLIREFLMGNYPLLVSLITVGSTSVLAVIAMWWATYQFKQESVLFRHAEEMKWSLFRRFSRK